MDEKLHIRPYARLITMLGDQLIRDETIALIELIKNSYDADASWVKISFENFGPDLAKTDKSKIVIEDNGCGMDDTILRKHWLNPATPEKLKQKKIKKTTQKGRIVQGEKGIGRFAVFKLGNIIEITTRRQMQDSDGNYINKGNSEEYSLLYDFSSYDDDFLTVNKQERELFIDDLDIILTSRKPEIIVENQIYLSSRKITREPYGTRIEISGIKAKWSPARLKIVQDNISRLQPIFQETNAPDFQVYYSGDGVSTSNYADKEKLIDALARKSVFRITNGRYNNQERTITFAINDMAMYLSLDDPEMIGNKKDYPSRFRNPGYITECGDFSFEFYVFDFNTDSQNPTRVYLDDEEKKLIRNHRIYLYRDGIRVMPYGDSSDDWLRIDISRGTVRASKFLSNDQIVGSISISQQNNPLLRDKTNREGLIEEGEAYADFIAIIRLILSYIRKKPFEQYLIDKRNKAEIEAIKHGRPQKIINTFREQYANDKKALSLLSSFEKRYITEKQVLQDRIAKTENLAAVGLSVETASHDIMLLIQRALEQQDSLIQDVSCDGEIDKQELGKALLSIRGAISMIQTQLKDIQLLFPSTKSRTKNINISDVVEKVYRIYKRALSDSHIAVAINRTTRPLIAKTTDAVLLQVFINLFDNSLYWLRTINTSRKIIITLDGDNQRLIFSDSGPGIKEDDASYIFEAFYSGKGEDGRGLGLYIARQLLDRYDYSISLAEFSKDKLLPGANFVIEFVKGE